MSRHCYFFVNNQASVSLEAAAHGLLQRCAYQHCAVTMAKLAGMPMFEVKHTERRLVKIGAIQD